jgi:ABC-2 type transport system permease protein
MPIFEDKYRPWVGRPQPRLRRVAILAREEFKLLFSGLWMRIVLGLIFLIAAGVSFLFFVLSSINVEPSRMLPQFSGNMVFRTYLSFAAILVVALAGVSASGLISKDLKSYATLLYFARPIGKGDYLLGKFLAAMGCLTLGTLLPAVLLWGAAIVFKMEEVSWGSRLRDLSSILAHSMLIMIPAASMVLALSACTRWTAMAGIVWVMLYVASVSVGAIGVNLTDDRMYELFSLAEIWDGLGNFLYEHRARGPRPSPPYALIHPVAILTGLTAAAWGLLFWRARRIERL